MPKKGRHRRFSEARELKRSQENLDRIFADIEEPCEECSVSAGIEHKSWCSLSQNSD